MFGFYKHHTRLDMGNKLVIVIPCYNEETVLPVTASEFLAEVEQLIEKGKIAPESFILFVDDGSKDHTWEIISELSRQNVHFKGLQQSRNRGHQNAVLAGLMEMKDSCDMTISIDCDGQDDIHVMEEMVDAYAQGAQIVYGVRKARRTDTFFKRTTAQGFYWFLNKLGVEVVYNHADYRLLSTVVLQHLADFKEVNIFLRGMVPLVGFQSTSVYYDRAERVAGESHYPLKKMIALAVDGITSLSIKPIRAISVLGCAISAVSVIGIVYSIISHVLGHTVAGWSSIVCIVCLLGGMQMVSLGILGEYIGKIYMEVKQRPRYIISATAGLQTKSSDIQKNTVARKKKCS